MPASGGSTSLRERESEESLPNLIVIGAQKCGTSSLHAYLDLHPEISMSAEKETNFFIWHYEHGAAWWRSQFRPGARVRGEASPHYTAYPMVRDVPERIMEWVPEAKLIYMVRDPIERLLSQYVHQWALGEVRCSPEELCRSPWFPESDHVYRGLYALQLEQFLRVFPRDRILVIEHLELLEDRIRTMRRVFRHAGVEPDFSSPAFANVHHRSSAKRRPVFPLRGRSPGEVTAMFARFPRPLGGLARRVLTRSVPPLALTPATRDRLAGYFRDDAAHLRELTGLELKHWSV